MYTITTNSVLDLFLGHLFQTKPPANPPESEGPAPQPDGPPEGIREGDNDPKAPQKGDYDKEPEEKPTWRG